MIYLQLFWSFFQIGLLSFGGGYAALPLIREQVVEQYHWLTMAEFSDLITISQMTPGPIAINSATFVGIQIAGTWGAVVSTLGCVIPSCVVVSLLAFLYYRYRTLSVLQGALYGIRPAVVALIASAGLTLLIEAWWPGGFAWNVPDAVAVALFSAALVVLRRWRPDPVLVMLGCGVIGGAAYLLLG